MTCFFCKGAAHPVDRSQYAANVLACGPCVRTFWDWVKWRVAGWKKRRHDFAAAAARAKTDVELNEWINAG
jgi:hypothetical protein